MSDINEDCNISYADFVMINEAHKKNFKQAMKIGRFNLSQLSMCPYMSYTIDSVNMKDGVAKVSSNTGDAYTTMRIVNMIFYILHSDVVHMSNPSRIKSWKGFMG